MATASVRWPPRPRRAPGRRATRARVDQPQDDLRPRPASRIAGIDDIYIDLTELPGESAALACQIKDAVRRASALSCSIGVAPNKLLAKLASDLDKPDGLTLLSWQDLATRVWPLPVRKLSGIGPKATARLDSLSIATIGELAAAPADMLTAQFGRSYGACLHEATLGRDKRPVVVTREPKSISRETTLERDLDPRADREAPSAILVDLCRRVRVGSLVRPHAVALQVTAAHPGESEESLPLWASCAAAIDGFDSENQG